SCISPILIFFFFHDPAPTEIYTLSLHDALPICVVRADQELFGRGGGLDPAHLLGLKLERSSQLLAERLRRPDGDDACVRGGGLRSEEHTSELQSRGHLVCRLLLEKKKKQK